MPNGVLSCVARSWINLAVRDVLLGLVIVVLGTASAQAREAAAIVRVRLLVPRGLDTTPATVQVRASDGQGRLSSQMLTGSGLVTFGGLPAATYRVTVDLAGAAAGALELGVETG